MQHSARPVIANTIAQTMLRVGAGGILMAHDALRTQEQAAGKAER